MVASRTACVGLFAVVLAGCSGQSQPPPAAPQPPESQRAPSGAAPQDASRQAVTKAATSLVERHGCVECHSVDEPVIGPAFRQVAARYTDASRRDYDLVLVNVARTRELPETAKSTVVVARVGSYLQIRIFDAEGRPIVDKTEHLLPEGPELALLKQRWSRDAITAAATLPETDRRQIVDAALSATGLTEDGAREALAQKITNGGKGNWTAISKGVPMPPFSERLSSDEVKTLVDWVLGLREGD